MPIINRKRRSSYLKDSCFDNKYFLIDNIKIVKIVIGIYLPLTRHFSLFSSYLEQYKHIETISHIDRRTKNLFTDIEIKGFQNNYLFSNVLYLITASVPEYNIIRISSRSKRSAALEESPTRTVQIDAFGEKKTLQLKPNLELSRSVPVFFADLHEEGTGDTDIGTPYQDETAQAAVIISHDPNTGHLMIEGTIGEELVVRPLPTSLHHLVPPNDVQTRGREEEASENTLTDEDEDLFNKQNQEGEDLAFSDGLPLVPDDEFVTGESVLPAPQNGGVNSTKTSLPDGLMLLRKRRAIASPSEGLHVIYKRKLPPVETDYAMLELDKIPLRSPETRSRRKREAPYVIYPEILVLVDYDGYLLHGQDNSKIKSYYVSFWNGVDLRYKLLSTPKVKISIAGIIISRSRDAMPYLERNRVGRDAIDSASALTDMGKYLYQERRLPTYDIAVAITKLGAVHDGSPPPSYLGGPGARHCKWKDGFIMSDLRHTERGFRWSPCSVEQFHHFLNGETATCLYNLPHEDESLPRILPGKLLTLDAQCRKDRGTTACFKDERVCAQLFCFDSSSGFCVSYRPAAEGSDCGNGKICLNGKCVYDNENSISDLDIHRSTWWNNNNNNNNNNSWKKNKHKTTPKPYNNYDYKTTSRWSSYTTRYTTTSTTTTTTTTTTPTSTTTSTTPTPYTIKYFPTQRTTSQYNNNEKEEKPPYNSIKQNDSNDECFDLLPNETSNLSCQDFLSKYGNRYCNHRYIYKNCCRSQKELC
ncbi:A disintegrin and metalloproteinase with thrombospondin motifs 16 [Armadillidium nasatum]|uniref:A disintegrin and metalloproteinase with thrombospondin motifs 16 n=1 Tax=Armadillidium nasatum TaxID=96803 RepID=A0A5N5SMF7_9CRUS|nr:A disintegrin and metalloproteinase with thrombospondin motifs 16 [Armadillidium nasatum]